MRWGQLSDRSRNEQDASGDARHPDQTPKTSTRRRHAFDSDRRAYDERRLALHHAGREQHCHPVAAAACAQHRETHTNA